MYHDKGLIFFSVIFEHLQRATRNPLTRPRGKKLHECMHNTNSFWDTKKKKKKKNLIDIFLCGEH